MSNLMKFVNEMEEGFIFSFDDLYERKLIFTSCEYRRVFQALLNIDKVAKVSDKE